MQGYKVDILTIVIGFFAGVQALRTLQIPVAPFRILLCLAVGIVAAVIFYCLAKAFLYGQHVRDIIREQCFPLSNSMLDQLDRMVHTTRGMVRDDPWPSCIARTLIELGSCNRSRLVALVYLLTGMAFFLFTWLITSPADLGFIWGFMVGFN